MNKEFKVAFRIWVVGGYSLKKDDVITIKHVNDEAGTLLIDNEYFEQPIWVFKNDFFANCVSND